MLLLLGDSVQATLRPQDGVLVLRLHQEEVPDFVLQILGVFRQGKFVYSVSVVY